MIPSNRAAQDLESIADSFFALDREWRFTFLSRHAERVLDGKHGELIGRQFWELYPNLHDTEVGLAYRNAANKNMASSVTAYYPDHNRWYEAHAYPAADGITVYFRDVTREKEVEAERARLLEESERQRRVYETALSNSADFNYTFDLEGRFTYVNSGLLALWGKSLAEAVGRTFFELDYEPDLAAKLHRQIQEVITTRQPVRDETPYVGATGGGIYEYIFVPVLGRDGTVEAVAGSTRDITARKASETATERLLREIEHERSRLEQVFQRAPSFMCVLKGPEHIFERVNDRYYEIVGRRPLIGKTVREALPEVVDQGFTTLLDKVYRTGEDHIARDTPLTLHRNPESEPETRFIDFVYQALRDVEGRVTGILAQGIDLTERKRAEAAARASDTRLRNIADAAQVLIWESDRKGVTFVNHHCLTFFGQGLEKIRAMGWAKFLHPEDFRRCVKAYRDAFARRRRFESLVRVRRFDGTYRWLLSTAFPHDDEDRQFCGMVGSSVDITDLKHAEEAQRQLAHELALAHRQKDEFLALLAHELRNPLAPLRTALQVMQLGHDVQSAARSREMMERQLGHMVRLVDDLLDVSRISTGKMQVRWQRVTIAEIVESAVETAGPAVEEAGHTLDIALPEAAIHLEADLTRMAQVLSNLLINSAKYTPCGGRITLSVEIESNEAVFHVRDTGIGLPPDALTSIFDMFAQVDRTIERATGGLGIGLALVKGLVDLHGGTVSASSAGIGQGSTFTVRLPLPDSLAQPAVDVRSKEKSEKPNQQRFLVVDDNRDAAISMVALLQLRGHHAECVHDGLAAVETTDRMRPDIVLMDIGMPGLNGYDATRQIRAEPWGRELVIIAITGWGEDTDRAESRDAGCDGHLVKPVRLADLEELIAKLTSPAGT